MDILLPYSKKRVNLCGKKATFFKSSVEAVFVLLFRRLLPEAKALSAVVLYRFDTMLLPCAIGAFFVLGEKISSFRRKKATTDGYDS